MFRKYPKHIALKMSIKAMKSCRRPLSTLTSLNFRLVKQKKNSKNDEKMRICNILGSKTPKNVLLTFNYGLPSSFATLSS